MNGFQLRRLHVTGPNQTPATIDFGTGLNVVSGASDTGKSYLVETIDYMLGGKTPPRNIPESRGYDRASLRIASHDGKIFDLTRALQGGDFQLEEIGARESINPVTLGSRHAASEGNISVFLLGLVGLAGMRIRKNVENVQQNLSFRNLAHLVIVDEESIIKKESPIFSGESTQRTVESGVFKLLLTGQDDSALIAIKKKAVARAELQAKIELLDQLTKDYEQELGKFTREPLELSSQHQKLTGSIEESGRIFRENSAVFEEHERRRKISWQQHEQIRARLSEISGLRERFQLLDQHYRSDLERLESVSEAGFFFVALEAGPCPLCGTITSEHRHEGVPHEGDIVATKTACDGEMVKIRQLQVELVQAMSDLETEQKNLIIQQLAALASYRDADNLVRNTLSPALSAARTEHTRLQEALLEVREALSLFERIKDLSNKRIEATKALEITGRIRDVRFGLPPDRIQSFSAVVESMLDSWGFPHEKPVQFDELKQDLVLGSRRRGEQGKGLRALTHAAFSIGLQEVCVKLRLPTVGFVILDSPLVTFRQADLNEAGMDATLQKEVKKAFYHDLSIRAKTSQVIIVENEDPQDSIRATINSHIFTNRPNFGRKGFFPESIPTHPKGQATQDSPAAQS